jgi:hypothetical protein
MLVAFTVAIVASIGGRGVVAPSGAFPAIHHGPRAAVRPKAAHFQSDARSAGFAQITLDAWPLPCGAAGMKGLHALKRTSALLLIAPDVLSSAGRRNADRADQVSSTAAAVYRWYTAVRYGTRNANVPGVDGR